MNHSIKIYPKAAWFIFAALTLTSGSCRNSAALNTPEPGMTQVSLKSATMPSTPDYICNPQSSPLIIKQNTKVGLVNLSVNPATGNIIVTVSTKEDWIMNNVRIYAGSLENLPVNSAGNPEIGLFPVNIGYSGQKYTCEINPKGFNTGSQNPYCAIVVHAKVKKLKENGRSNQPEDAWIEGTRIGSRDSWVTYYSYNLMPCGGTRTP